MSGWNIKSSDFSKRAINPIRNIVDKLQIDPNAEKPFISLSIGDPTVFGNFNVHHSANEAVIRQLNSFKHNGYTPASGTTTARDAIARKHTVAGIAPLTTNDVLLTHGCSHALDICITALCNPGQNILLPRPGFSLYKSLAVVNEIEVRFYDLLPEHNWHVDIKQLESLIDENTACILVNNPSNPCGSVYPKEHLQDVLAVAAKHYVPIIADEIYCDLVFKENTFYPMATLTQDVPILSVGGLSKKWLVPGWRVGWILVHDRHNAFDAEVRAALSNLSALLLAPNSVLQSALEDILHNTPQTFYDETIKQIEHNANISYDMLSKIDGLTPVTPQGAMYMMVGLDISKFKDISSDVEFSQKLVAEENVLCLPGQCFDYPNYIRLVITPPADSLKVAYARIEEFCSRHRKMDVAIDVIPE